MASQLLRASAVALALLCAAPAGALRAAPAEPPSASGGEILVLTVSGPISPPVAAYVADGVAQAARRRAALVVLELDTPGGLDTSMRQITQSLLNSAVPAVVYVFPSGGRAASAGTFITLAADVAAMAPGTTLGAAHPVNLLGKPDEETERKSVNDSAAYIRGIAERRGRNASWAEKAVRESASLTATEALRERAIDLIAPDLPALLAALDGRVLQRPDGPLALRTAGRPVARLAMGGQQRLLVLLADPNVVYLLLMAGIVGIFFELAHPGVIFPGVLGGISLVLALYALQTLPVSAAGVLLILLAVALFVAEIKVVSHGILGIGGVVALALGSVMLIRSPAPWLRISLTVIAPVVALTAAFFLVVLRLVLKARRRRPATGREGMIGAVGEALGDLAPGGRIFVRGEIWEAHSPVAVRRGDRVEVTAVHGLTLEVRPHREE
jgi:membrane-bound serine protease (ClpP class)